MSNVDLTNTDYIALRAARAARTPELAEKLVAAAQAMLDLANEVRMDPGMGIGLSYARIWTAVDEAQSAMMKYQNRPIG